MQIDSALSVHARQLASDGPPSRCGQIHALPSMSVRGRSAFDGCYEAERAAALAGVPVSTLYYWARNGVVTPSLSQTRPKLWSYADLMALRIVYWLRHPKDTDDGPVPASPMNQVRWALETLDARGADLWAPSQLTAKSPLLVDRHGRIYLESDDLVDSTGSVPFLGREYLDLLGPFDSGVGLIGPDLRVPRPHLRIVPGRMSGQPHLEHSRLTTSSVAALGHRGYELSAIRALYPDESAEGLGEAIDLEDHLAA